MINKLGRQLIAPLTIIALILPSLTYAEKTPAQRLAETRKDDRRQCEAEVTSGTPSFGEAVAGAVTKPLKDAIKEETGKAMPKAVNEALANRIPAGIETGIKKELPDIVTEGLKRELPLTLGEQIKAEMAARDLTFQEVVRSNRFTGLVRASIDESLPRIIQDGLHDRLPNIIDESIRVELPNALRLEFNKVAKPTIKNHFEAQINTMIGQIPVMVRDEIQNLQATIQGTISGLQAAIQSLATSRDPLGLALNVFTAIATFIATGDVDASLNAIPEIAQITALIKNLKTQVDATKEFFAWATALIANKDLLVQNLVDGFTLELSQSLTNPKNIAHLADAIGSAMTDPINRSLDNAVERIESSIEGPINDAINGVNGLPDRFFSEIDAALDDISELVNLEIEMVVQAVTNPIVSTIDVVSTNLAATIDRTLDGVLSPIINDTGNLLGSVGNAIAFDMRFAAVETHVAIFGSEGVFVDQTEEALWPNGATGLQEPPSYLAIAPGDPGYEEPFSLARPPEGVGVGPPGSEEFFAPELALDPVGPLTEATEEFSAGAAEAVTDPAKVETVVGDAVAKTSGLPSLSGMASSLVPGAISAMGGVLTGFLKTGNPLADAAIAVVVNKAMAAASAAVFGAAGAVLAVPVTEIGALLAVNQSTDSTTSKILQTSEQIKAMTEKIYSLQVQACTHLKVVQRVQLALETKELLNDREAREANAYALYRAQVAFVNEFLNQGREISDGMTGVATDGTKKNKGSLIIKNLPDHINEARQEENLVFQAQLKELETDDENYPNLKTIREALEAEDNQDLAVALGGSLTKTEITKFRDEPETLTNDEFWQTFQALGDPRNNVYGQKLIAQGIRDQRVAEAENAAQDEYVAGRGYAGTRECIATTADGKYCAKWQTLTPGSTIGGFNDRLAQVAIEQAAASDELIEDSTKSEVALSAKRVENLSNLSETVPKFSDTAKQSVFKQPDPCPGPGPCSGTGWPRTARPTLPALPSSGSGNGSSGGSSGGSLSLSLPNGSGATPPLTAAFGPDLANPTIAEVNAGAPNQTIINWSSSQATTCIAKNDWPSARVGNNVKTAGADVGKSGSVTINHPINFSTVPVFSRISSAENLVGPILTKTEITRDKLKQKTTFKPVNAAGIHPDDVYRLTLYRNGAPLALDVGGPGLTNPPTAATVIKLFRDRIALGQEENSPLGDELRKYVFTKIGDDTLVMSPSLTYQLTCSRGEESIDKEFTITRQ